MACIDFSWTLRHWGLCPKNALKHNIEDLGSAFFFSSISLLQSTGPKSSRLLDSWFPVLLRTGCSIHVSPRSVLSGLGAQRKSYLIGIKKFLSWVDVGFVTNVTSIIDVKLLGWSIISKINAKSTLCV